MPKNLNLNLPPLPEDPPLLKLLKKFEAKKPGNDDVGNFAKELYIETWNETEKAVQIAANKLMYTRPSRSQNKHNTSLFFPTVLTKEIVSYALGKEQKIYQPPIDKKSSCCVIL